VQIFDKKYQFSRKLLTDILFEKTRKIEDREINIIKDSKKTFIVTCHEVICTNRKKYISLVSRNGAF